MVKVQAHFHHNRDGIYIGEGRIPELLRVHIVGYDGRIPSLKRLLIREVIYSRILSHLPLRWLPSCRDSKMRVLAQTTTFTTFVARQRTR